MDNLLKQRLVGALILVALGVVFWPIIFVEPEREVESSQVRIPPRPQVDNSPVEPPDTVGLRRSPQWQAREEAQQSAEPPEPLVMPVPGDAAQTPEPEVAAVSATPEPADSAADQPEVERRTREEAPESPALDAQGVPIAWILQVATMANEENAENLRRGLLDMGEKAYIKKVRRDGRALYRVYVGPGFEKARIEQLKPRVDAAFGVQSVVQRYLP